MYPSPNTDPTDGTTCNVPARVPLWFSAPLPPPPVLVLQLARPFTRTGDPPMSEARLELVLLVELMRALVDDDDLRGEKPTGSTREVQSAGIGVGVGVGVEV